MVHCGADLLKKLPLNLNGWQPAKSDQIYDRTNLYDYIDGGAELYFSYGFQRLFSRTYFKQDQPEILVDIFDMGDSTGAFGVFSHGRDKIGSDFGQGSEYSDGLLRFWKERFYISILAFPETNQARLAIMELGTIIADSIPNEGSLPEILDFLPKEGLIENSVRYFRHHAWINAYCYISDENILDINRNTEVILAEYESGTKHCFLLIVDYPDVKRSMVAYGKFLRLYMGEGGKDGVFKHKDGKWSVCKKIKNVIVAGLKAKTQKQALNLVEKVEKIIRNRSKH